MSKYSGRRVARGPERPTAHASASATPSPPPSPERRGLFLLAGGITVTLVAWGVLVFIAIEFGRQARTGSGTAWGLLGLATVGAAACLYLTLLLAMKTVEVMQRKPVAALPAVPAAVPAPRVVTSTASAASAAASSSALSSPPSSSLPSPTSASAPPPSSRPAPRRARQSVEHTRRPARTAGKRVKR